MKEQWQPWRQVIQVSRTVQPQVLLLIRSSITDWNDWNAVVEEQVIIIMGRPCSGVLIGWVVNTV